MKQGFFEVLSNRPLTANVFEMTLRGDTSAITRPGQFVNIRLDGFYLRRPISVCDCENGILTLIVKIVGRGGNLLLDVGPTPEGTLPAETYELMRVYSIYEMIPETRRMTAIALRLSVSLSFIESLMEAALFFILLNNICAYLTNYKYTKYLLYWAFYVKNNNLSKTGDI